MTDGKCPCDGLKKDSERKVERDGSVIVSLGKQAEQYTAVWEPVSLMTQGTLPLGFSHE
jgi:hypothetical protein